MVTYLDGEDLFSPIKHPVLVYVQFNHVGHGQSLVHLDPSVLIDCTELLLQPGHEVKHSLLPTEKISIPDLRVDVVVVGMNKCSPVPF